MITWSGLVLVVLDALGILLLEHVIPLSEPFRSFLLCAVLSTAGGLACFGSRRVTSPVFASSAVKYEKEPA